MTDMGRRPKGSPGYDELIEELTKVYTSGASISECSERFNISTTTVIDWLKKAQVHVRSVRETIALQKELGTYRPPPRRYNPTRKELEELYINQGLSCQAIADHHRVGIDVLMIRMDELGIERTKESRNRARIATNRERYGGDSPFSDPEVAARRLETNLLKYGTENPFQSEEIKSKIKQTNLERYGSEFPTRSPEVQAKTKNTNLERYGVEHPLQSEVFKQRVREFYQDPEVRARMQPIWDKNAAELKRVRDTPEWKLWYRNRMMELYGRPAPNMQHLSLEAVDALSSRTKLKKYIEDFNLKSTMQLYQRLGCSESLANTRLHQYDLWDEFDHYTSSYEFELGDIFSGLGIMYEKTRSVLPGRYEIDFFMEEHRLGIEFNGDYYHSEALKEEKYHQKKSLLGEEEGVFIYHIFEYEWLDPNKKSKILSQLMNLLQLNSTSIGARNCEVREIESSQKNQFLNSYHLQGEENSTIRLGLFYKDELVSVMTFGRPRFNQDKVYEWELYRFATKSGTNISGGASKLFRYFVKKYNPKSVLSYSDFSKTRGRIYPELGFEFVKLTTPGYVWNNMMGKVRSRYATQGVGEKQEMESQGFIRIFNSGNKVWAWTPDS